jgi:hypothetical protein
MTLHAAAGPVFPAGPFCVIPTAIAVGKRDCTPETLRSISEAAALELKNANQRSFFVTVDIKRLPHIKISLYDYGT